MRKSTRNYLLTTGMGLLGFVLTLSTVMLWVVLPNGYYPSRLLWVAVHQWGGLALELLVLLHVLLHWGWVMRMTKQLLGRLPQSPGGLRDGRTAGTVDMERDDR